MSEKLNVKLLKRDIRNFVALYTWEFNTKTIRLVERARNRLSTFAWNKIDHYPPTKKEIRDYCD